MLLSVAHAEACYEWTREYINERKAFGGETENPMTPLCMYSMDMP